MIIYISFPKERIACITINVTTAPGTPVARWLFCMTIISMVSLFLVSMMTSSNGIIFRVTGPLCGEFTVPVNSPHKGQWRGALMFSLIYVWINGWVNNREAGDLRRYRVHYDVIVMHTIMISQLILYFYGTFVWHGKQNMMSDTNMRLLRERMPQLIF